MPNRILKESIRTSSTIDSLSAEEEVFFYRLVVTADDYGRMDARTTILRSQCFSLRIDRVTDADVEKWLGALERAELIRLYHADDIDYLQITTWSEHQQIRAKRSRYPEPPDRICNHLIADASNSPRNPNPNPYRNLNPNTESESESVSESESESDGSAAANDVRESEPTRDVPLPKSDVLYSADFEAFWRNYPRRVSKHAAWGQWSRRLKAGAKAADLVAAATHLTEQIERGEKEPQFVWHPATFLGPDQHYLDYVAGVPVERVVAPSRSPRGSPAPAEPAGFAGIRGALESTDDGLGGGGRGGSIGAGTPRQGFGSANGPTVLRGAGAV